MIFELSDFFNNPSLVEIGPLKIQYYAVTWLLSAVLIYMFLSRHTIIKELGLNKDEVNDMVFLYGLFFGAPKNRPYKKTISFTSSLFKPSSLIIVCLDRNI